MNLMTVQNNSSRTTHHRFGAGFLLTLLIAVGSFFGATSAQAAASSLQGTVSYENLATGAALDSNFNGAVYAGAANGGLYQKWVATPTIYGAVTLRNMATGRCLDSNTQRRVYTLRCNGGSFQKWVVMNSDYGTVVLQNVATGFVLDSSGKSVYTLGANGGSFQKWFAR